MTKILWLDDEPDNIAVEQDIFEDEFDNQALAVEIEIVECLDDCLEKLASDVYEAVILDLQINLGANADAVQQTWAGAGAYAWLRLAGNVEHVEGLPDLVREKLGKKEAPPKLENQNVPIAIVSGVAKNEVVTFIRTLNLGKTARPLLQVFDKPIDHQKFTEFASQVAKQCQSNK